MTLSANLWDTPGVNESKLAARLRAYSDCSHSCPTPYTYNKICYNIGPNKSVSHAKSYCAFSGGELYRFDDIEMNKDIFIVGKDNLWVDFEKYYEKDSAVLKDSNGKFVTRGFPNNISNDFSYYGRTMKWIDGMTVDPLKKCVVIIGETLYSSRCDFGHAFCLKSICNIKLGDACKSDKECLSNNCSNSTCQCGVNLESVNGLCVWNIACQNDVQCLNMIDNSQCYKKKCRCVSPYIMINGGCIKKRSIGDRCYNHSECEFRQCQSRCKCPTGTFLDNNVCSEGRRFNESCSNSEQCEAFNARSTCDPLKGVCKCKNRHTTFMRYGCGLAKKHFKCLAAVTMYHKDWQMFVNLTDYEKMLMTRDLEDKIHARLKREFHIFRDLLMIFNNLNSSDYKRPHFLMYLYLARVDDHLANVKRGLNVILPVEFHSAPYQYWDTPLSLTIEEVEVNPIKDMCMDDYHDAGYILMLCAAFMAIIFLPILYLWYLKKKRLREGRNPWKQAYFNQKIIIPYTVQELRVTLTQLNILDNRNPKSGLIVYEERDITKMFEQFLKLYLKYYYEIYYDFDYRYEYDIDFDYWARFSRVNEHVWPKVDYSAEVFEVPRKISSEKLKKKDEARRKGSKYMNMGDDYELKGSLNSDFSL
ncbi:uncharacterized protein LOC135922708 [Gordionus sp. m RMFG-2023]|uniref:uncharacterized protein LOC135922708 n=1 Tax=Gordionus sp. m RMFG-2023 TaxID=3053472 RepID=UPI0031FBC1BC